MRIAVLRFYRLVCLVPLVSALPARDADGAGTVVPGVRITIESNDNPTLRTAGDAPAFEQTATRLVAEARVRATRFTPRAELTIEPAIRSDTYADPLYDNLQSTDLFLRGNGRLLLQRSNLGFDANIAHERLLGTDFLDGTPGDPNVPDDVDGVLLGQDEQRTLYSFSPYTQTDFGERSRVRLDLRAMDVSYDDERLVSARTDFTAWELGAAYVRIRNTRTTFGTRVFGGRYEAEDARNVTDGTGIAMSVAHALSSIWSVSAAVGFERLDFTYRDTTGNSFEGIHDNPVLDVDLRKHKERSSLGIGLSRRARPDSFGSVIISNELSTALQRDLSPTLRGGVVLRAIRTDDLAMIPSDREYGRLELTLSWSLSELWSLLAGYERSYWRNVAADSSASSNSVVFGLNYLGRSQRTRP